VKGKHVSGFTNGEEEEMKLTHVVPFLVEDELMRLGAIFEKVRNWGAIFRRGRTPDHGAEPRLIDRYGKKSAERARRA
jgi:hypothetical protein